MDVPFFRYPHVFESHRDQLTQAFLDVASRGAFILQGEVTQFENELAAYCGARHAIGVGNATDAMELGLAAAELGPGDEVILCSHTFVATASAIVSVGATPVFSEVGADHLMDPEDTATRVTDRTRALMPTQLNGRTANMQPFQELVDTHDLILLEDSAQGLGSTFKGRMSGTFGLAGVFSFYPAKTLGALGDGGALITDDDDVAAQVRMRRDHGRRANGTGVHLWGGNSRLDNLQAAMLLVKLRDIDVEISRRRELAARYHEGLAEIADLVLPPPPDESPDHFDVYQNYEVESTRRDALKAYLSEQGVGTILQWGGVRRARV